MKIISLICFCIAGLIITSKAPPQSSIWAFKDPLKRNHRMEVHNFSKGTCLIPFSWIKVNCSTLDSMVESGYVYDSIMNRKSMRLSEDLVDEVLLFLPDSLRLFYSRTDTVQFDTCKIFYQTFEIYPKLGAVVDDNVYELYYLKGLGFFGAIYVNVEYDRNEWSYYSLQDLKDKKGKSVIDKDKLKIIVDTVLNRRIKM